MPLDQELRQVGRRATDDLYTRLCIVEISVDKLEKDVCEHRGMTERMCETLDEIRHEISGAKGFLKAITLGSTIFTGAIVILFTIQWLKIPV